jgi:hypothetical protein
VYPLAGQVNLQEQEPLIQGSAVLPLLLGPTGIKISNTKTKEKQNKQNKQNIQNIITLKTDPKSSLSLLMIPTGSKISNTKQKRRRTETNKITL